MKEVTDPAILNQLEGKEVTDPKILAQLEGKPSLSLGNKVMSEAEQFFQTPFKGTMDIANAVTGGVLYPVSKLANWGTAAYGKITGDPNWQQNAYNAEQTIQGLNPIPTGQQAFGGEPSPLQQGAEAFSVVQKPAEWTKEKVGYVPGEIAEQFTNYLMGRPLLKPKAQAAPGTPAQLAARTVAQENKLPALPTTVSDSFLAKRVEKITGPFKNAISPMFEEVKDFIGNKINESNIKIKETVDKITTEFKTVDEQVKFLEEKGGTYDAIYAQLPEKFDLPGFKTWLSKQVTKLEDLAQKQKGGLKKQQYSELVEYQNYLDKAESGGFSPSDISRINGKNDIPPNRRTGARFAIREDLKSFTNGEEIGNKLIEANKEYSLTTRSRLITSFLDKVSDQNGNIDFAKWDRNYDNFRLNNTTRMPKEIMQSFAEIDTMVKNRNIFKTDMETMFKRELDLYEKYKNNPTPTTLDKIMNGIANATIFGAGGATLFSNYIGWQPALYGGGLFALQQTAKQGAKSAVKPTGTVHNMLLKNQTPMELKYINDLMRRKK